MTDRTPNLGLPLMATNQDAPDVIYDEAMQILDDATGSITIKKIGDSPAGDASGHELHFSGDGVTVTQQTDGVVLIDIAGSAPSSDTGSDTHSDVAASITVTDGSHTVTDVTEINFTSGATVSSGGSGVADVAISGGGGGGGDANIEPGAHPGTADALDDEFEGTSLDTKWSWINQGTTSLAFDEGSAVFGTNTDGLVHAIAQAISASTWTIQLRLKYYNSPGFGIYLGNSSSGKNYNYLAAAGGNFECYAFNSPTSYNSNPFGANYTGHTISFSGEWNYMRVQNDGTNLNFLASWMGFEGTFQQLGTVTLASFISSVDQVGIVWNNSGNANALAFADHFRRIA